MSFHWDTDVIHDERLDAYWEKQVFITGTDVQSADPDQVGGTMVAVEFTRTTPSTTREDRAMFTLHLSGEAISGQAGVGLGNADMAAAEADLDTWHTSFKDKIASAWTLAGYTWRDFRASNPISDKTGLSMYSPVKRTTIRSVVGTDIGIALPYQVASTITFKTGSRKHWGRSYVPGLSATALSTNGRIGATYESAFMGAWTALYNGLFANSIATDIVVWSPKYRAIMAVRELQVDDIPDIIRRRRAKQAFSVARATS